MVGTLVGGCRCSASWCNLDLTFDLAVVTLTFKILSGNISETVKCRKLIVGRDIAQGLQVCIIVFSLLINAVISLLNCLVLILYLSIHYLYLRCYFSVLKPLYCFTTSISHGVENYFPRLWGTSISDAIFKQLAMAVILIFKMRPKFCRQVFIAINIPCNFCEDIFINL